MYVPRMDWADGSDAVMIQQLNRKQDTNRVFLADAKTAAITELFVEREETFIEDVIDPEWLKNEDAFIWHSERSGWRHIYKVSRDGKSFIDLTPGEFDVIDFDIRRRAEWLAVFHRLARERHAALPVSQSTRRQWPAGESDAG